MTKGVSQGGDIRASAGRSRLQVLLGLLALAVAILLVMVSVWLRRPPQRAAAGISVPPVSARAAGVPDIPQAIRRRGHVSPGVEVDIMPEVAGRVIFVHSELKEGGVIHAGEKIVQIDPSDYELAVRKARAMVAEAQARLEIETSAMDIQRRDWRQLHGGAEPESPLVLGEPLARQARASLDWAKAQLAAAELQLQRTVLSLPFDVLVAARSVDLGQYVVVGHPLATVYGIDVFEIVIGLEEEELARLDGIEACFPSSGGSAPENRIPVEVKTSLAGRGQTWRGYISRVAGRVDRTSGAIPVVVEVPRPLEAPGGVAPLLPGASVEVFISPSPPESAGKASEDALHDTGRY